MVPRITSRRFTGQIVQRDPWRGCVPHRPIRRSAGPGLCAFRLFLLFLLLHFLNAVKEQAVQGRGVGKLTMQNIIAVFPAASRRSNLPFFKP
jgi:hypothetical protein